MTVLYLYVFAMNEEDIVKEFVEVRLLKPENFLKIRETLTRIGISGFDRTLYQSCHILCKKKTKYYIVHFKELFKLDGKHSTMTDEDYLRRNSIIDLLQKWNLLEVIDPEKIKNKLDNISEKLTVLSYDEAKKWKLIPKHPLGGFNGKRKKSF